MKKYTAILVLIICVVLLSGCGPSEAKIQEAIEKTQMAQAEMPPDALPTNAPTQVVEPTLVPDSWVIDGDLRDYMLTEEDIANEGYNFHYTTFDFYESEYETTNEDLIESDDYDEFDDALIYNLGRITSWDRQFMKSEKDANGKVISESNALSCRITSFKTVDAAKIAVERYNYAEQGINLAYFDKVLDLGDKNVIYRGGVLTGIEFSYRNVVVRILYTGKPDLDITEAFARIVFEKLQNAPLAP
ncbi:MAG TPA: hypothetical protein PLH64_01085 [Anaerolineaceae bacterium]|nr:hypothetical protein [Anaerolineaceae bacterium]